MNLIKWGDNDAYFPTLPSLLEDFFAKDSFGALLNKSLNVPAVNIKEENDKFVVSLAAPGLEKGDFKVKVENGTLTVSSSKKEEKKDEKKGKYSRYEYNYSSFSRSFSLPENADADNTKAKYKNGELVVTIPKKEPADSTTSEVEIE